MTTPAWSAPQNGLPGNLDATNSATQLNQLLGTHASGVVGFGNQVVSSPTSQQTYFAAAVLSDSDFAQSFTMSGTTIGRITFPIEIRGNGVDLLVTLCPDNSGVPNQAAPITQVMVPASIINATVAQDGLENATGPFQLSWNNTQWASNFSPSVPWVSPAATVNGAPSFFGVATSGNYTIFAGGQDQTSGASVNNCFSVLYTGAGTVAPPVPQTPLPTATHNGMVAVTSDTVVYIGGFQSGSAPTADVWSASWDPNTGNIGAWAAVTALPQATQSGSSASYGENIYMVGGLTGTTSSTAVSNVWMATLQNSQLSSWTALNPLPSPVYLPFCSIIDNWIVVAGGQNTSGTYLSTCYYAPINPVDGSIGAWLTGPSLAQAVGALAPQWCLGTTSTSMIVYSGVTTGGVGGVYMQVLEVGPSGIAPTWNIMTCNLTGTRAASAFTDGAGIWYVMGYNTNNTVQQNLFRSPGLLSVPMATTGLTNGANYWVIFQTVNSVSASDHLALAFSEFSSTYANALRSPRYQNTWTTFNANSSVPLVVYDTTAGATVIHAVDDIGTLTPTYQRWSTFTYNDMNLLSGVLSVTMQPNNALNANPTFTSGVSPWTAVNGTITQSNAQTHGGFPFSGLLTPTGGFTQASAESELFAVQQTLYGDVQWVYTTGYFYSPTGTTNFSLSVNWYDSGQNLISTSSATTTLTINTWTQVSNYFEPPITAAYAQIAPTEGGSPGATNLVYLSNVYLILSAETVSSLVSLAQVDYGSTDWPPIGVTQLN